MSKGLEALENARRYKTILKASGFDYDSLNINFAIIEKELKTLEVISKYFYSEHIIHDLYCLGATDEEIALAREVLKE